MTHDVHAMWMCGQCDKLHQRRYQSEECCQPEVTQVWICAVCEEAYECESDAQDCCPDYVPAPPTGPELEAMGQKRLDGL